jgi:thioredoxin-related protein
MSNSLRALRGAIAALALSSFALAGEATWFADFDVAQKEAEKTGKDLFVDFTGSDWCSWCVRLHKEVFDQEAFQQGIAGDYILVALDFPRDEEIKAKVPNPERNEELMQLHRIESFPTILLMTAKGEVYGRTGYQAGGPEKYLEHVGALRKSGREVLTKLPELVAAMQTGELSARLAAWDKLADIAAGLDVSSPLVERVIEPLQLALELDPKNEHGRKLRALELLFKFNQAEAGMIAAARELDPKNERGLFEKSLKAAFMTVQDEAGARAALADLTAFDQSLKFKDTKLGAELCTMAAVWLNGPLEEPEGAKAWAQKAMALGIEDENVKAMLEEVLGG